jgi:hypothetical protein
MIFGKLPHRRISIMLLLGALLCVCGVGAPASVAASTNLVANPGAEAGNTSNWSSSGFGVAQYGSSTNVPSQAVASYNGLGSWLFVGEQTGAILTQQVSVAGLAPQIDGGGQMFTVRAMLGGAGPGADGVELLVQPQNTAGEALGSPVQLGPPTAAEREDQATMLYCSALMTVPVGMRSASITLRAVGSPNAATTGDADNLELYPSEPAVPVESSFATLASSPGVQGKCTHTLFPPEAWAPIPSTSPPSGVLPPPCGCVGHTEPVTVSHLRLTSTRLLLSVSNPTTVHVVITRHDHAGKSASRHAHAWNTVLRLTFHAHAAGVISRHLHRLIAGQYRVTANAVGGTKPIAVTTHLGN